eukprot:scaffold5092_cov179-Amphora_coffeaeformis.AAC.3
MPPSRSWPNQVAPPPLEKEERPGDLLPEKWEVNNKARGLVVTEGGGEIAGVALAAGAEAKICKSAEHKSIAVIVVVDELGATAAAVVTGGVTTPAFAFSRTLAGDDFKIDQN